MPVHLEKKDGQWAVVDDKGKVHGKHGQDKKKATSQMNIINAVLHGKEPKK